MPGTGLQDLENVTGVNKSKWRGLWWPLGNALESYGSCSMHGGRRDPLWYPCATDDGRDLVRRR